MYKLDLISLSLDCQSWCESNSFSVATEGLDKVCTQYCNTAAVTLLLPGTFHLREPTAPSLLLSDTWRTSLTTESLGQVGKR